ncbi:vWA domain-containing protein [Xanthomarina sp. GH4-25]|uniref:vWA domain-containing protein n=1 Tax=Xanthomarina sp. GH4-25 TaxID=3349335 RepID=UPI003877B3E8
MIEKLKHIDWDKFHFLRPEYMWFAIPLAIIVFLGILAYAENTSWKKHISEHLRPFVIQNGTSWKSRMIHFSLFLLFGIGFLGFLGPTWEEVKEPTKKLKSQLVIALDLSQSMLATDVSPTRLERAKFKIQDFLEANPRAEAALQVFAASTHTVVPFTTDYKIILDHLDGLKPSMMPKRGTGFDNLFANLDSLFVDNKAEGKILLFTDDLEGLDVQKVSAFMQQNNVVLNVYPMATMVGGNVPSFYNQKYPLKIKGKIVTSKRNQAVTDNLAGIKNVHVLDMSLDNSDVKLLAEEISKHLIFEEKPKDDEKNWQDNGYWLVIPVLFLFIFSFRRGWAIYSVLLLVSLSSCTKVHDAKDSEKISFKDLWYTKAYQGQQAYDKGNYASAAKLYEDPLHQGVSYFKQGDYLSAKTAFEKDSSKTGVYNLGLTYAKLGNLEKSQEIFESLVAKDPTFDEAQNNLNQINQAILASKSFAPENAELNEEKPNAKNKKNDSMEDLSGGGQKATKKDMEKQRMEEETTTDKRMGKELDEVPEDFKSGEGGVPKNVLMRKVDDDPALFLTKKFKYQIKKKQVNAEETPNSW